MANRRDIKVRIRGLEQTLRALDGVKRGVRNRVIRAAVNAASTPVLKEIKSRVPKETGLLRRSIGRKMWTAKRTGTVIAIIGPRRKFRQQVIAKKGWRKGKIRHSDSTFSDPTKYAHLVEYGVDPHFMPKRGAVHPGAAPQPFVRPGWLATKGIAEAIIRKRIEEGVHSEARKYAKKGKSIFK